jgi:hypothetical protein
MRLRLAIASTLLAAVAGCACDAVPDGAVTDCDALVTPGVAATDLLFVVDDSGSMAGEQEELAQNLTAFIQALLGSPVELDLRIGVTNTSVTAFDGTAGSYPTSPAPAGTPYPAGTFVAVEDAGGVVTPGAFAWDPGTFGTATGGWGGPRLLSSAELPEAALERFFRANVQVGTRGSGKEQPLAAMRLALEKTRAGDVNDGFRRPGARLAVVLITDEDDCSETAAPFDVVDNAGCHTAAFKTTRLDPLADFVSFLDTTVGGAPIVAVVAGFDPATLDPTGCAAAGGTSSSDDPTRLDALLGLLEAAHPGRTFKDSICASFGPPLLSIASMIIPQTMPLEAAPADWRMLAVSVERGGSSVPCRLAAAGSPEAASADAVFTPPQPGAASTLTFQRSCTLGVGDRVGIRIVCVR